MVKQSERLKNAYKELIRTIERMHDPDLLGRFLRSSMLFYKRFSPRNAILIYTHRPDASYVLGMRQWNALGRKVKKGEKAIWIFAPKTRRKGSLSIKRKNEPYTIPLSVYIRDVPDDEIEAKQAEHRAIVEKAVAEGKPVPALVLADYPDLARKFLQNLNAESEDPQSPPRFIMVPVFDVAQTEGPPVRLLQYKQKSTPIPDDLVQRLIAYATLNLGVDVEFKNLEGKYGCFVKDEGKIYVRHDLSPLETAATLLHEIAHVHLHKDPPNCSNINQREKLPVKEIEAEAVAFTVTSALGYPNTPSKVWITEAIHPEEGYKAEIAMLRSFDTIIHTSQTILRSVGDYEQRMVIYD